MDRSKRRQSEILDSNPANIQVDEGHLPRLEREFDEKVPEEVLKLLLPVAERLMRFMPSERIPASQALDLVKVVRQNLADKATLSHC